MIAGTLGFAAVGTLFAAMLVRARSRDVLLPVLLYPITVPVIIAGVRATVAIAQPEFDAEIVRFWLVAAGRVRCGLHHAGAVDVRAGHDRLSEREKIKDAMPKWFHPATVVCGAMFAASPFVIANAPYESTMGLVQKVFYYHMPSAWMFLVASIVCGVASVRFLARGNSRHDRTALAAAEMAVLFGLLTLVTGPLWARKAWGTWWVWDARITSSLVGWMIAVGLSDPSAIRRAGIGKAGRGAGALRHGQRALHLHLRELLADDSSGDDRRAQAAVLDGISAAVLPCRVHAADGAADDAAHAGRRAAGAPRRPLPFTGRAT